MTKIKSLEESFSEAEQQLAEISLNIQDSTKIDNILTKESALLIKYIIEIVARHAFEIGYAGCADHIRKNSNSLNNQVKMLNKLPNVKDKLSCLNGFLDFNVKNIFKDVINEQVLDEDTSVSKKYYLKFFLLKACESALNQTLTDLTVINNKCLPNPTPKINIDFSKIKWNKVK